MQDHEAKQIIGRGEVIFESYMPLDEAVAVASKRFPERNICVVGNWFWIDLEAPPQVMDDLSKQGKQPVMLLAFDVLFSTSGANQSGEWLRTTPLVEFSDGIFFQTEHTIYVLMRYGRRNTIPLSTVIRLF